MARSDGSGRRGSGTGSDRGVTALAGVFLLLGIVAVGAVLVVATGTVALDAVGQQAAEEQSIRTMDVVRSGVEDAQYGQRERFEDVWATEELGTMTLEVNGDPDARVTMSMGAFLHESEGGRYASQLGGTWTETDTGSRMIHEPALEHTRRTEGDADVWALSVPPVELEEVTETNAADGVVAGYRPSNEPVAEEMIAGLEDDERLRDVTITIEDTPYAAAWARYLEDELPTHRDDSEVIRNGSTVVATAPLGLDASERDDDDERSHPPGGIEGPDRSFDATVTLLGADFGWSPRMGPVADLFDPLDIFDPGERDSFDVDLPDAAFEDVGDPDGELEYWQTASGTTTTAETSERTIRGETTRGALNRSDPADAVELDVDAGETVVVTAADESTALSLGEAEPSLFADDIVRDRGRVELTAEETTTLSLGVVTDAEREYELAVERRQHYEELTFDATAYDEFRIELTADDSDFFLELREDGEVMEDTGVLFTGDARWTAEAGETIDARYRAYHTTTSFDGGEATIRIGSLEGNEPIDYEVSLEQTRVDSSVFDVAGDPPWFQQFPIETALQFRDGTGTTVVEPWPETDPAAVSDPAAAHDGDINHPSVEYPLTYEVENLEPGTTFAPAVSWRDGFCGSMDSYAGTWRTPDGGEHEDELLFEMGCSETDDDWLDRLDVFDWFDTGDELNRHLDGFDYVDGERDAETDGKRVQILEDGDRVPNVEPTGAQTGLREMLGEKLVYDETDETYRLDLDSDEYALLFELAPEEYLGTDAPTWEDALESGSDGPDYNDLVMTFEIDDDEGGSDHVAHDGSNRRYDDALAVNGGVITVEDA